MDAPNPSATPTFASRTPLHIGSYGLAVRDLERVAGFYRDVLGLTELDGGNGSVRLGVDGVPLLELTHRPDFKADDMRTAGLYHAAYLMPTRADLGRWLVHVAHDQVPITGASDHGVSEAVYLDDPEGNGIEVYSDRPSSDWHWQDGRVSMKTAALDVQSLLRLGAEQMPWISAPGGFRIGHIHLRVGAVETAEQFYQGTIGLEPTRSRGGATFMSSGRYHHHVGANVWQSAGAGRRDDDRAGLRWFAFEAQDGATFNTVRERLQAAGVSMASVANGVEVSDPWGTRVRLLPA